MSRPPLPPTDSVRRRMTSTRRRDTPAELALRRALHGRGLRYRVDMDLRPATKGRPDVVFISPRIAIFVDGCFWHRCPEHGTAPTTNSAWWEEKLTRNVERDRRHDQELQDAGWRVVHIWEHEDPREAADRIETLVRGYIMGRPHGR